jgi:hypothetical protein
VTGNSKSVTTDPNHGDYYKLLDTGTYQLTFSSPGYISQTISGVAVTWGTPTVLNVQMQPVAYGDIAGTVLAVGGAPLAATVKAYKQPLNTLTTTVTANAAGAYTVSHLDYGSYKLVFSYATYAPVERTVTVDAPSVTAPTVYLPHSVALTPFASNFDNGLATEWTGTWGVIAPGADGTAYAMTDTPVGSYLNNSTTYCAMATGADLSDLVSGDLTYRAKWVIELNWDGVQLQVSVDGGLTWTPVATARTQPGFGQGVQTAGQPWYEGSQTAYVTETVSLSPWLGQPDVRFRFMLRSDSGTRYDGFTFDTFTIAGVGVEPYSPVTDVPAVTRLAGVQPNPFNPSTTVRFELARSAQARVRVYDVSGRLVRTLVDGPRPAGMQSVVWDGRDDAGQPAASGVYLVRMAADGVEQSVKASLVK